MSTTSFDRVTDKAPPPKDSRPDALQSFALAFHGAVDQTVLGSDVMKFKPQEPQTVSFEAKDDTMKKYLASAALDQGAKTGPSDASQNTAMDRLIAGVNTGKGLNNLDDEHEKLAKVA